MRNNLVLIQGLNHPVLMVSYTTNSFGDQLITFTHETINVITIITEVTRHEGNHYFGKADLLALYKNLN